MKTDQVSLVVEAKDGRPLRCYSHDGKTFVESHENREYQLRVKNKTDRRIKAVISVDSLNIVSGKPATNDKDETGYLLNPYEEQVFRGYRVDDDTIAQFVFVKREKSYATEKGEGQGNGVIAMRVYAEKEKEDMAKVWRDLYEKERDKPREKEYIWPVRPWYWEDEYWPYRPRPWHRTPYWGGVWTGGYVGSSTTADLTLFSNCTNQVSCNASSIQNASFTADSASIKACAMGSQFAAQAEAKAEENPFSMGSAWGSAVKDTVKMVEFEVGKLIAEIAIYYAAIEGLKALGVNVDRVKAVAFPEPFKREYCAKPSGWQG